MYVGQQFRLLNSVTITTNRLSLVSIFEYVDDFKWLRYKSFHIIGCHSISLGSIGDGATRTIYLIWCQSGKVDYSPQLDCEIATEFCFDS